MASNPILDRAAACRTADLAYHSCQKQCRLDHEKRMLLSTVDFDYHRDDKTVVVEKASSPTMADILAADGTEKLQIA